MRDIPYFKFWCHKVLPLVYDESLSYYEVLCKIYGKLNELIERVNNIDGYIDEVINEKLTDEHLLELFHVFIVGIENAISANNEGTNTNSSTDYNVGQLLWLNDILYKVIRDIDAGDTFIVDSNIEEITFEELFDSFFEEIKHDITANDDGFNETASEDRTKGDWLWLGDELYIVTSDIQRGNAYLKDGEHANLRKIEIDNEVEVVYYPNDKRLTLHGKVSDYQQIITAGDYHIYSPNIEAIEIKRID